MQRSSEPITTVEVTCCICGTTDAEPRGSGPDYEYRTSPDVFNAVTCRRDGLVYLSPRPALSELPRIYPHDYHAFDFSSSRFSIIYRVRSRLEGYRALRWARHVPPEGRILDVGCGDGFHLDLLRTYGDRSWKLEGVDPDPRAVGAARAKGLEVHEGFVQDIDATSSFDLAILNHTIEHVDDPAAVLSRVRELLRPGGRVVITTDNTDSFDARLFRRSYWGGYHFPRHWSLFNARSMLALSEKVGLEVVELKGVVSPVNWTYSIRNLLDAHGASDRTLAWFSLSSTIALACFTVFDSLNKLVGRAALIRAVLRRPAISGG